MRWIEASNKYMRLRTAARVKAAALGGCAYLVGSALTSETRPRDVDVRIVLSDALFEARYSISVTDWQWEARIADWSDERWNWYREQERIRIMLADACGERTVDLGILPESPWQAVYQSAPHEEWGAWRPEPGMMERMHRKDVQILGVDREPLVSYMAELAAFPSLGIGDKALLRLTLDAYGTLDMQGDTGVNTIKDREVRGEVGSDT